MISPAFALPNAKQNPPSKPYTVQKSAVRRNSSNYTWGWGYYLALGLLFVGLLSWGVFDIRLGYFVPTLCRLKNKQKRQVVLIFDDRPTELTPLFLDLLNRKRFACSQCDFSITKIPGGRDLICSKLELFNFICLVLE